MRMRRVQGAKYEVQRLIGVVLLVVPGLACGEIVERIVAKANQDVITKTEWDEMVEATLASRKEPGADRAKIAGSVLETMIADRLIVQAAVEKGIKVNDSEVAPQVDQELEALKARFPSTKEFNAQLRREGITYADLRHRYVRQMKDRFLYLKMMNLKQRELESTVEATDEEIQAYYAKGKEKGEWMTPFQVRARHIQFTVDSEKKGAERARALDEARKRVRAAQAALARGEAFADVAASLSEDLLTKEEGGDLGRFGKGTFEDSLEKVIFSLKPGETGGPIESAVGVHLVKVEEILEPRVKTLEDTVKPPAPLAEQYGEAGEMTLKRYIRAILLNEKLSGRLQDWVKSLKDRALIERFLETPAKS